MLLPTSRLYLRWSEHVDFEDCRKIVTDFADDNFTNAVDSNIWHEEVDGTTYTLMNVVFGHLIYKIDRDTLTYNGKLHSISGEHPNGDNYLSAFDGLSCYHDVTYRKITNRMSSFSGSCLFWAVSKEVPIFSGDTMFGVWKVYHDVSEFSRGRYILVITDEPTLEMYETIERVVTNGSKVLVITNWTPRLPRTLNNRTWCFVKMTHQGKRGRIKCWNFIPERMSRVKSARK